MINTPVLVLDRTYMPVNIVNVKKAISYITKNKADTVEESEDFLHAANIIYKIPSVVRLNEFCGLARFSKIKIKFNKKTLFERDTYRCQYCNKLLTIGIATIDHVIPKSTPYKGRTSWKNCVIACEPCNNKKGNRTPIEANMPLKKNPTYPHYFTHVKKILRKNSKERKAWIPYFIY